MVSRIEWRELQNRRIKTVPNDVSQSRMIASTAVNNFLESQKTEHSEMSSFRINAENGTPTIE